MKLREKNFVMEKIEHTILRNLVYNEDYLRRVLPFIKKEYFDQRLDGVVFETISSFVVQYDTLPTKEILSIELDKRCDLTQDEYNTVIDSVSKFDDAVSENEWLVNTTEKWCRDRAIYLALMESIALADDKQNDEKKAVMLFHLFFLTH